MPIAKTIRVAVYETHAICTLEERQRIMVILGISFWPGSHDSSAAVVVDGSLERMAQEEWFTRVKHDGQFPTSAIEYCLSDLSLKPSDVTAVVLASKPYRFGSDSSFAEATVPFLIDLARSGVVRWRSVVNKLLQTSYSAMGPPGKLSFGLETGLSGAFEILDQRFALRPSLFFGHHAAHAAAAYFSTDLDCATVNTIDGRGAWFSTSSWAAKGNVLRMLAAEPYTNSLGFFYRDCTDFLSFGKFAEGKTMGLSSYGDRRAFKKRIERLLQVGGAKPFFYKAAPSESVLGFTKREQTQNPLEEVFVDFAAACQSQLETAVSEVASRAIELSGVANYCGSGGVALNCSANGMLISTGLVENVNFFPAAGDAGLSAGAAYLASADSTRKRPRPLQTVYLGPQFASSECETAVTGHGDLMWSRPGQLVQVVAELLAHGLVVGWFQGRMEIGPRALGARSILADPRDSGIRDRVNKLKGRESWRPLAPVVMEESAYRYFDLSAPSPHMLIAAKVHQHVRQLIPGVVHVDGTARPQTVNQQQNPILHELLTRFNRLTGLPILLNTSFNCAGEPIVCSPSNAISSFHRMELDVLVLEDILIFGNPAGIPPESQTNSSRQVYPNFGNK